MKFFVKTCEEFIDVINIDNELNEVMEIFHRAKIEQIDKHITRIMRTARKKVEGQMMELGKSIMI